MTDVYGGQSPDDSRKVVRSFNEDGSANFAQVGVEELSYKGHYGAVSTSTTENEISIGQKYFTLDRDESSFKIGDDILINSQDPDCFMWGEIIDRDTVSEPARILVFIDSISPYTGTYAEWELQVVARPKPGIEKDISLSSIDPTGDGPFTFTVTAGKAFPPGAKLLLKPNTDRAKFLIGTVDVYSSTSLRLRKSYTNVTSSTTYSSWSIGLLDAPITIKPLFLVSHRSVQTGFRIANEFFLPSPNNTLDKTHNTFAKGDLGGVALVSLAGTITTTSGSKNIVGVGTSFLTGLLGATPSSTGSGTLITTVGNRTYQIESVTDDTHAALVSNASANEAGVAYSRGIKSFSSSTGFVSIFADGNPVVMYVNVIREDATGDLDICYSTVNAAEAYDIPGGWTLVEKVATLTAATSASYSDIQVTHDTAIEFKDFLPTDAAVAIAAHIADTSDAHDASAISYAGGTGMSATDVEAAIDELATEKQNIDATLTALAAYNTNGLLTQTAADTFAGRTLTGTANQITVTNGDGVSGNPALSLPADVIVPTVLTAPNTGLHILDTNASHDLIVKPGSDLSADRTLTITTGDADRTLTIAADATISGTNTGDETAGGILTKLLTVDGTGSGLDADTIDGNNVGTSGATVPLLNGTNTHSGARNSFTGLFSLGAASSKTIATGAITVTSSHTIVDTESAAATDDLDTISGGSDGDILILRSANSARDPTVRDDNTSGGNISLAGSVAFTFATIRDRLVLVYDGAASSWRELSRATN